MVAEVLTVMRFVGGFSRSECVLSGGPRPTAKKSEIKGLSVANTTPDRGSLEEKDDLPQTAIFSGRKGSPL